MTAIDKVSVMLGKKLKNLREEKGWSQEELALKSNLNRAYVGYIERGERNPSVRTIAKLANILKVPLHEVFKF